jgi:hypothetical protein
VIDPVGADLAQAATRLAGPPVSDGYGPAPRAPGRVREACEAWAVQLAAAAYLA